MPPHIEPSRPSDSCPKPGSRGITGSITEQGLPPGWVSKKDAPIASSDPRASLRPGVRAFGDCPVRGGAKVSNSSGALGLSCWAPHPVSWCCVHKGAVQDAWRGFRVCLMLAELSSILLPELEKSPFTNSVHPGPLSTGWDGVLLWVGNLGEGGSGQRGRMGESGTLAA